MKIRPFFYLSVLLVAFMGCSTRSIPLPKSKGISYIIVKEGLGEVNKQEPVYDIDEEGNVTVIEDENESAKSIATYKYRELFRISDPKIIKLFVDKLKHDTKGEANITFSGTLPSAIFINKAGKPVFSVSIICDDSSISIYKHIISIDESKKIITCTVDDKLIASGINRPYVKAFFQILKQKAPTEIEKREKYYKKQGGLEEILKIKTP